MPVAFCTQCALPAVPAADALGELCLLHTQVHTRVWWVPWHQHGFEGLECACAGIGVVGSLANLLWVEPLATGIMFQRYELENAAGERDEGETSPADVPVLPRCRWRRQAAAQKAPCVTHTTPCVCVAAAIKQLYKKFGMWHGISSLFNLAVLVAAIAHGWWLSGALALA